MSTISTALECTAGRARTFSRGTPNDDGSYGGLFTGTETITANVWAADSQSVLLTVSGPPKCSWTAAATSYWQVTLADTDTASLTPGIYRFEVVSTTATSGETARLFEGTLEVTSSPGSSSAAPPDLITAYYFFKLTSESEWTIGQQESVPDMITAACDAFRSWCNNPFWQSTYTKEFVPGLDGVVRLDYVPVNQVFYVRSVPEDVLTVQNTSAQIAYAGFATTGDIQGGQTITGVSLSWTTNGTPSSTTVTLSANETLSSLATAINAVGSGWSATTNSSYNSFPVTVLQGGLTAQGCATGDPGATFWAYSETLAGAHLDHDNGQRNGMLVTGEQGARLAMRWGPGGEDMFGFSQNTQGKVLVSYNAGFAVIPRDVQQAVAHLTKYGLERLASDQTLKSEKAGEYQYELKEELDFMPKAVKEVANRYRIVNA